MKTFELENAELESLSINEINEIDGGYMSIREAGHAIISWLFD